MILNDQEIKTLSAGVPPLVSPFQESGLRLSSYDLTVGDEYYDGPKDKTNTVTTEHLRPGQAFTIPPHGVCFILAAEHIALPADITARVSLRMTLIYRGLVMTAQPPFDPGYDGKVIVMIHNLSTQPHHLQRGQRIATIEFARVSPPPPAGNPAPHRNVVDLLGQISAPVSSSLVDIAKSADSAKKLVRNFAFQAIGFASLLVAAVAIPGIITSSIFFDRLADQKVRIDDLNKTIGEDKVSAEASRLRWSQKIDEQSVLIKNLETRLEEMKALHPKPTLAPAIESKQRAIGKG